MLPDRVSNPGPLTYESGALPIALRRPAITDLNAYTLLNTDFRDYPTWGLQMYFTPNQYPVSKSSLHYSGQGVI